MAIKRGTFTVTFLFNTDLTPVDEIRGMSVDELLAETDSGSAIGGLKGELVIEDVAPEQVVPALLELGNDGTFFDSDED